MDDLKQTKSTENKIIGLIPAGGKAERLAPLPCSKELYPIGFQHFENGRSLHPKPVCLYLLEKMWLASIEKAYIILRNGKWDIPAYLADGSSLNINLAYLIARLPFGVPYTLDTAYPFVQDSIIVFGFPDIIFEPDDAFQQLLARHASTNADIVLGLFPVDKPPKWHMVEVNNEGRILKIIKNPNQTKLKYTWIIAVWTPVFSSFMHEYLKKIREKNENLGDNNNSLIQQELFLSDVIQDAINNDLHVEGVIFPDKTCLDIGTMDDLVKAMRQII
jgi:glucose-1-phosphate thymidylyltransferase